MKIGMLSKVRLCGKGLVTSLHRAFKFLFLFFSCSSKFLSFRLEDDDQLCLDVAFLGQYLRGFLGSFLG